MSMEELIIKHKKYNGKLDAISLILMLQFLLLLTLSLLQMWFYLFLVMATLIISVKYMAKINGIVKETKAKIREILISSQLKGKLIDIEYSSTEGFDDAYILKYVCSVYGSTISSYDLLKAKYGNTKIKYAYCHVITKSRRGHRVHFSGKVIEIDFPKKIDGYVSLTQPKLIYKFDGIDEIVVENMEFDENFNVYSNVPHSVFFILTPHYMEKLINLNVKYKKEIKIYFYDSKLVISINDNYNSLRTYDTYSSQDLKKIEKNIDNLVKLIKDFV